MWKEENKTKNEKTEKKNEKKNITHIDAGGGPEVNPFEVPSEYLYAFVSRSVSVRMYRRYLPIGLYGYIIYMVIIILYIHNILGISSTHNIILLPLYCFARHLSRRRRRRFISLTWPFYTRIPIYCYYHYYYTIRSRTPIVHARYLLYTARNRIHPVSYYYYCYIRAPMNYKYTSVPVYL